MRLLLVNLFAILFFCVEKYVIAPQERANFIAFTERFVEKKVKLFSELEDLPQAEDVKTKGRAVRVAPALALEQTKKYDELIRNLRWLNHRITQAAFISSRGNILNSVQNSLFLWEEKQTLWELALNSKKIRGGRPDAISISDRLYTLKPVLLSGQNVYLALEWDFAESSLGFYVLVLLGVLSALSLFFTSLPSFPRVEKKVAGGPETGAKGFSDKPDRETRRIAAETKPNTQGDPRSVFGGELSYKDDAKNFILMDPTLEEYQKITSIHFGESDPIQRIRQKAFDPETKELIEKVSSESPHESDDAKPQSDHSKPESGQAKPQSDHSKPQSDHTEPQSDHTEPQSGQAKPESDHTEPQSDHAKPQSDHAEAQSDHSKSESGQAKPESDHSKPESGQAKPQSDHAKPQSDHAEAQSDHTEPQSDHTEPQSDHAEAQSDHTEPQSDYAKPQSDHAEAQSGHAEAQSDYAKPQSDHSKPESNYAEAQSDHAKPQSDHAEAQSDHAKPQSDHAEAQSDHAEAQSDHAKPQSDHAKPQSDHAEAQSDHTEPQSDHTEPQSDHAKSESGQAKPESDHSKPESDHTEPQSDHAEPESDHAEPESDHAEAQSGQAEAQSGHAKPQSDDAKPESNYAEQLERLQETFQEWGKSPQIALLNHIYEAKPGVRHSLEFLTSHLHYIARDFHADSLIFLSLNSEINCFGPLTFFGMPAEAVKNFYIHRKDPLFPIRMGQPTLVMIDEATKNNPYFIKKLNKRLASQMEWVGLLPLNFLKLDILLVLFYKKSFSKEEMEEMVSPWKKRLIEISPIIKRVVFAHPKPEHNPRSQLLIELKKMISLGVRPLNVLHVRTSYLISPDSFKKLSRAIKNLLKDNERLFYISPKCLIAYLSSTSVSEFLSKTKPFMAGKLTHQARAYPDEGEILDLYFE